MKKTNVIETQRWESPAGELLLGAIRGKLCLCDWVKSGHRRAIDNRLQRHLCAVYEENATPVVEEAIRQLGEYFTHRRKNFSLPIQLVGTRYQCNVWSYLPLIPYGKTITYCELAETVATGNDIRAVSGAVGANALSIIVPCHRIVGAGGKLTGYAGGLDAKRFLLNLERED